MEAGSEGVRRHLGRALVRFGLGVHRFLPLQS